MLPNPLLGTGEMPMLNIRFALSVAVMVLASATSSAARDATSPHFCAGVPEVHGTSLDTELVADGLKEPVHLTAPSLELDRLFVVEQAGTIRVIHNGKVLSKPFLDIRDRVRSGGERGLLSLAFHPSYTVNRRFFVYYTDRTGDLILSEFLTSDDPDKADPSTERQLLAIDHRKYANHNGGQLAFGPDHFLYLGPGDGGSGGDPDNHGQDLRVLLGKLLRIDVDKREGGKPYGIPPSNPFVKKKTAAPEIWAYGLRNPWRFSFDRDTGDLYIADVGQSTSEEVDVQPASSHGGENYGWRYMEGLHCFNPPSKCPTEGLTTPVLEYPTSPPGAITGGFVYRGCRMPDLHGTYFYSDYYKGFIRTFTLAQGRATKLEDVTRQLTPRSFSGKHHISSFGEDARGEIYLLEHQSGEIYRVIPGTSRIDSRNIVR
jgi:glucose/arabinose dehydrogenase